jgi:hypothetical protein
MGVKPMTVSTSAVALRQYRRLARALLLARELAGGELSQDEEAERADELDLYWQQMTADERRAIEDEVIVIHRAG